MRKYRQDEIPGLWWSPPRFPSEQDLPYPYGIPRHVQLPEVELATRKPCRLCGGPPVDPTGFEHTVDCRITVRRRGRIERIEAEIRSAEVDRDVPTGFGSREPSGDVDLIFELGRMCEAAHHGWPPPTDTIDAEAVSAIASISRRLGITADRVMDKTIELTRSTTGQRGGHLRLVKS